MPTTAVLVLEQRLGEGIDDFIEVTVTTALAANALIISTDLNEYDGGRDDYFNEWWVYIVNYTNIAVQRKVKDYATSTGQLTVYGDNLTAEPFSSYKATIRLHRYNRDWYIQAFNDTVRELHQPLFRNLDIAELVTGNALPNSHFRDWDATTAPNKYSLTNASATADADASNFRGGAKSAKVVATAGAGYMFISSNTYNKLLDLMGKTVSFRCWVKPEVTDDATLVIYTLQADGTAQTLTSTTSCPAGYWTLLELEDQELNDNLTEIHFRFVITTNTKYAYFDHARVTGRDVYEYMLPVDIRDGNLDSVEVQVSGDSDRICDDMAPRFWEKIFGWDIVSDGTDEYLRLAQLISSGKLIRLIGTTPLSTVSADDDEIEIAGEKINLFIAYSKYKLWQKIEGPVSSEDSARYGTNSAKAYGEYLRLVRTHRMTTPKPTMKLPTW